MQGFLVELLVGFFGTLVKELFVQFNLAGSRPITATDAKAADASFKAAWDGSLAGQLERMRLVREKQGGIR
jgi:hypothetical protein